MRHRAVWAAIAGVGLTAGPASGGRDLSGPVPGTVVRVIDGDSLVVEARIWLDQVVTANVRLERNPIRLHHSQRP